MTAPLIASLVIAALFITVIGAIVIANRREERRKRELAAKE